VAAERSNRIARQSTPSIRSGAFDNYLDFDKAIRDPKNPSRIYPPYDSGDHVHPNSAGYAQMAKQYPRL
jgi:lysophospholipase L1-like esterase